MTQKVPRKLPKESPVKSWDSTRDVLHDVHHSLKELRGGADPEVSKVELRAFHLAIQVIKVEVEYARLSKSITKDSTKLQSVNISGK